MKVFPVKIFNRIKCYIKAFAYFIESGIWSPHIYKDEDYERCIIIATSRGFRVSKNMHHTQGETVYPDACLIKGRCIYCGAKELSWSRSWMDAMRQAGELHREMGDRNE